MHIEDSHIIDLIKELEFLIQEASSVPFNSHKCSIERQDALDIISDIKRALPRELEQAKSVAEESKDIMNRAIAEAQEMLDDAEKKAVEIIEEAKAEAEEIKVGTAEYADELLSEVEEHIVTILDEIRKNREEFK